MLANSFNRALSESRPSWYLSLCWVPKHRTIDDLAVEEEISWTMKGKPRKKGCTENTTRYFERESNVTAKIISLCLEFERSKSSKWATTNWVTVSNISLFALIEVVTGHSRMKECWWKEWKIFTQMADPTRAPDCPIIARWLVASVLYIPM